MRAWFFSENAYHLLPDAREYDSIRVKLPNRYYDPKIGADLYHRFIDEWLLAEELGLEIMVNEHHQTATNVNPSAAVVMGALARAPRVWLRPRRAVRDVRRQPPSHAHDGALLGGARPDRQGVDEPRRALQLGREVLPPPPGEHLAASVSGAPSADLDHRAEPEQRARGGGALVHGGLL